MLQIRRYFAYFLQYQALCICPFWPFSLYLPPQMPLLAPCRVLVLLIDNLSSKLINASEGLLRLIIAIALLRRFL